MPRGGIAIDITGQRFGRLVALERDANNGKLVRFRCQCDCGDLVTVRSDLLRRGETTSCGCFRREAIRTRMMGNIPASKTHGMQGSKTYAAWAAAIQRCENPKHAHYARYGGRGIRVCKRWRDSFSAFLEDMGEAPVGLTLDRADNNRGYEPGNCRWATHRVQQYNRSNNVRLAFAGRRMLLPEWADCLGIPIRTLQSRLKAGMPAHKVLSPVELKRGRPKTVA